MFLRAADRSGLVTEQRLAATYKNEPIAALSSKNRYEVNHVKVTFTTKETACPTKQVALKWYRVKQRSDHFKIECRLINASSGIAVQMGSRSSCGPAPEPPDLTKPIER
jgi:hypothetical protein